MEGGFTTLIHRFTEYDPDFVKCIDMFLERGADVTDGIRQAGEIPWLVDYLIKKGRVNVDSVIREFVMNNAPTSSIRTLIDNGAKLEGLLSICPESPRVIDMIERRLDNVILLLESGAKLDSPFGKRLLMGGLTRLQIEPDSAELEKYRMIVRIVSKM